MKPPLRITLPVAVSVVLLALLLPRLMRDSRELDAESQRFDSLSERLEEMRREIRLESRVRKNARASFPAKFAELQSPSSRGTVAFFLTSPQPVTRETRDRAAACGARVIGFVPVNALLVEADAAALAKLAASGAFSSACEADPCDKLQAHLRESFAASPDGKIEVTVVPLASADIAVIRDFIVGHNGADYEGEQQRGTLRALVDAPCAAALACRGDVRWIEEFHPPTLQNNVAVNPGLMNVRTVWNNLGLTGAGQIISTSDSGLDTGDISTLHADFAGRICALRLGPETASAVDTSGHGTHTAGSLVGTGARSGGEITGVAPGARLCVTAALKSGTVDRLAPGPMVDIFRPDGVSEVASFHSGSWGSECYGYDADCAELDVYVWAHPDFLPVFSAGNSGTSMSILSPAAAKNCLAVGATESLRPEVDPGGYADNPAQIAYLSSGGPTRDKRIKPDLCAPGTYILSTRSSCTQSEMWGIYNAYYAYNGGTSMSCPLAAGSAALVREWLVDRRGFAKPTAALVKAVLLGGAHDMYADPGSNVGSAAPNNVQGWGRVDLGESLYPSNRAVRLVDRIPFAVDGVYATRVVVTNSAPLDVRLVWIDFPAEYGASTALVNDLDLVVSNETSGVVWRGNGAPLGDRRNNVEGVHLAVAEPGSYVVSVKGVTVPFDYREGGAAALYVRGAIEAEDDVKDAGGGDPGEIVLFELRKMSYFPEISDWGSSSSSQYPSGHVVRVKVPLDLPDYYERLTDLEWTNDETGEVSWLAPQRLTEIAVAPQNGVGTLQLDALGRMATAFDVVMDRDRDVRFCYYSENNFNVAAGLPDWWWRRYLRLSPLGRATDDPDGDGMTNAAECEVGTDPLDAESDFRILAFSPTNIVWRGGRECRQVVEYAVHPDAPAQEWTELCGQDPPCPVTNSCPLTVELGSPVFIRLRSVVDDDE